MSLKIFNNRNMIDFISSTFAMELSEGGRLRSFSIRNIRSIAGLVRFGLLDMLLYGKKQSSALKTIREKITKGGIPVVEGAGKTASS